MLKVGLTGGIGSGKSYVARKFEGLGIPVYYADKEAKRLMIQNQPLKQALKELLGKSAYHRNGRLNRAYVAGKIFKDGALLQKVNKLVHPAVKEDFSHWAETQKAPYVLEESAILYENGLARHFDHIIVVTAEEKLRIARVIKRDKISAEQVISRMKQQFPDKKKVALANFVIRNNKDSKLKTQISTIHKALIKLSKA